MRNLLLRTGVLTLLFALLLMTAACNSESAGSSDESSSGGTGAAVGEGPIDSALFADPADPYGMLKMVHSFEKLYGENTTVGFFDTLRKNGYSGLVTNVSFGSYLVGERMWNIFTEELNLCAENGVRAWIYDEQGYPSGGAEQLVLTDNPEYEALGLVRVQTPVKGGETLTLALPAVHNVPFSAAAYIGTSDNDKDISSVVDLLEFVDEAGTLTWTAPEGDDWLVETYSTKPLYEDTHAEGNAHQDRRYVNIMDSDAIAKFINVTYDAYYERVGELFGNTVEAFFTDEPSIIGFYVGDFGTNVPVIAEPDPDFVRYPMVAWTDDFFEQFETRNGYDLRPLMTFIFGGDGEEAARVRYDYWETAAALIEESYYKQIADWCTAHNVQFSGHLLAEEQINTQVICEGNFFRNISHMTLPGIDMLNSSPEGVMGQAMTPKLVSSIAHIYDREKVMSEASAYSNQDSSGLTVSLDEIRCALAVQYALGVNQINSYYGYTDLSPADATDEQSAQTGELVARMGYALDGGEHVSDVALYYPYETMYAEILPTIENWNEPRTERVGKTCDAFQGVFSALLRSKLDLDIMNDEAILGGSAVDGQFVSPGGESFRVIVMPPVTMLSSAVVDKLTELADAGVRIVFLSEGDVFYTPTGEDTAAVAEKWAALRAHENASVCDTIEAAVGQVKADIGTLDLAVSSEGGRTFDQISSGASIVYNHKRMENYDVYLLVNYGAAAFDGSFTFRAEGGVRLLDPLTGEIAAAESVANGDGTTTVDISFDAYDYIIVEISR